MMAMAAKTAEATARATRELERRIKARDERAIQILEKLRREQAIGERLEAQNAAATNTGTAAGQAKKRKKRNKKPPPAIMPGPVPMIIKIDSDNHSTQAISLAVPPPPLAGGTAAGPTTTSVSPKPPQPRRALPVPHHVITPHPAPSLSVGTNSFTATPALIFPDFDHDTKPFMQRITLTLTNTSGMTNTVRFHHLDQHLKDKGVSVAWAPVSGEHEHPEAKVVPGRLSPGRGAKMIVKLNVKTALKVDESGQDHADLTGYVWFEAHVGGVFSVPIQATRGRSRVEIVRDLNSSGDDSVRVGECLVGGSGSAVIRVANRGIVDTEISVECEKSNISGENVFSVRGDEATGAATVVIPGYATNTIIPLKFTPSTPGVHTSRIKIKDVKTGKKICSVPIRGDAMPPPLSVPPKTSVGTLAMSSGSVGDNSNNTAVSVGLVLKNTSTSCIHVKVLPVPTHPAVEISVSPTTVAVHRGVFRVSVRVAPLPAIPGGASHGGPFSIPLRFKYELSSGNWGFVETLVEGIATRLELDAPTKGVKAPDCTVWDSGVDMFVPIENLGVVDQIVECRVSHPGVLQLATIIGIGDDQSSDSERSIASAAEGKASPHQLVRIGKGQQVQGAALKMTIGPGSKIRIPLTFHPRAWASGSGDVRNTRGGGGGGGARGPHSTSTRRTTPYLTLTTAHQTYRVPIHVAPTRPVLRFQPGAITTTAVARGSSRDVAATLVRCRTVAEEKRGDEGPLDEVRYTIGSAEAVDGITVDAGVASQGEVHLGELTLQLRVDVDEEVFAKRKEQEVTVPVRFERTSAVSGAVTSSVAAFIIRVPVVEPDIWTTATKISLGPLARGVRTVHGIPISNNSDEAAAVTLWLISGDADSFFAIENGEIISDSSRKGRVVMIEPDQTAELPIAFQPTKAGPCSSIWECASECTQVRVTVDGRGVVPVVAWGVMDVVDDFAADDDQQQQQKVKEEEQMQLVQPELIMFRDLGLGDIAIKKILIRNGGDEDVEVFIALEGTGAPASPFSLSANAMKATLTVPVVASSTSTQAIAGRATSPAARSTSATATAADPAPTPAPAAPTTQTLTIPARCTKSIPLTFLPTCENDHFSTTLTISCPGAPTTSARVVGRCWDTSTAVIGYDVQPEGMRDGPWDIPPAVFIQHHCHDLKLDNTSSTDSDTEQEVDDDESDYAKSGPTVPPPTPAEPPATTPSSLMQELDLLRPVELETMHYGMLHLKWARHPSGTGYILPATSSFLTLVNMRPPPLRETGPAEQLHGGVKIGAGGKATMQTPAEKQAAKAAKKLAGGAKAPPVVPADFVVDRYDTTLKYYPSLGVYYPDMSGNDEDDIVGPDALKIVVEGSEGTVEQGGERKIRICVARANAPDASKPHTADNKAPSAASVTPAAAVAAPMKRANSSKKRDTNKDQPPTTDPSAAVPAAAVAAPTPDPPVPNPVKLESCFKVTLNGGLKLGTGIMPATENRVWILGIVIDGVEEEAK
ncbi:hypothetical protein DFJ77DRAFT_450677 [Powellomyces hirtus]|nr:hypothetical protein DFJ77DRAFT_450677 [Powellomyces hirtus]